MVTHGSRFETSRFWPPRMQPREAIHDYPLASALLMFGLGLGVGILIGQALSEPLKTALYPEPSIAEKLGRSVHEAVQNVLPEGVSRRVMG